MGETLIAVSEIGACVLTDAWTYDVGCYKRLPTVERLGEGGPALCAGHIIQFLDVCAHSNLEIARGNKQCGEHKAYNKKLILKKHK